MGKRKIWILVGLAVAALAGIALWMRSRARGSVEYDDGAAPDGGNAPAGGGSGTYPALPAVIAAAVKGVARITKCMGNLRVSGDNWQGKSGAYDGFEAFADWAYGARATLITLRTYMNRYGRKTIRDIIAAYAPSTENSTDAYIQRVSLLMNRQPDATLALTDIPLLCAAIHMHECGIPDTLWGDMRQWTLSVNNHFSIA